MYIKELCIKKKVLGFSFDFKVVIFLMKIIAKKIKLK